jgi:hypothetical protein
MMNTETVPVLTSDLLLVSVLKTQKSLTIDQLIERLPELRWNEVFHAIDRLSRQGSITLTRDGFDYVVALPAITSRCA